MRVHFAAVLEKPQVCFWHSGGRTPTQERVAKNAATRDDFIFFYFFYFSDRVPAVVSAGTLHYFLFYFPPLHRRFEARQ